MRCEHSGTFMNIAAAEQVRWLPCHIALPGNAFWLFDGRLVRWSHFTGDGSSRGPEHSNRPFSREAVAQEDGGGVADGLVADAAVVKRL
ncbi:DUF6879 family protein [Streptomyces sp. VB1]|uniref:DUF6879 family protein n=1 Tax=Streptomyces sp. VB1 TaxID=2986803 RepID=UPI003A1019D6